MQKLGDQTKWNDLHKENENYIQNQYPTDMLITYVRHHIKTKEGSILDIGIGNAISTAYLLESTKLKIFGIDYSKIAITRAKEKFDSNDISNKEVTLQVASFTQLPFEDESMDYIFAQDCLYYGGKTVFAAAIHEILRVLKKNGTVRFSVKSSEDRYAKEIDRLNESDYRINQSSWEDDLTLYCPSLGELSKELEGFSNYSIGYLNYDYTGLSGKKSFHVVTAIK